MASNANRNKQLGVVLPKKGPMRDLIVAALAQDWRVEYNGHYKLYSPDGKTILTLGSTESDWRGVKNNIARARRAGIKI